jgi:putative aldouronate transport system substrate-binding protein
MDELGIANPTNYNEFIAMLTKFKEEKNVIPLTAAGFINTETPYTIYMREFYQDADPHFYKDSSGEYVCGMQQPEMIGALQRMQDAYKAGLIDSEIVTNKTSTCRDKFNGGEAACFNYWAGSWNDKLQKEVEKANQGGIVRPLTPIVEAEYVERPPTAFVIAQAYTDNPEGVFKYFIEYSHDGGEGQMLFTHGVEDGKCKSGKRGHWAKQEDGTAIALGYRENEEKPVEKSFYAPELSITTWDDIVGYDESYRPSLEIFGANSRVEPVPRSSDTINDELPELTTIRTEIISNVVLGKMTPQEGIDEFNRRAESQISRILEDLNSEE